jgi:hypothetical protein
VVTPKGLQLASQKPPASTNTSLSKSTYVLDRRRRTPTPSTQADFLNALGLRRLPIGQNRYGIGD